MQKFLEFKRLTEVKNQKQNLKRYSSKKNKKPGPLILLPDEIERKNYKGFFKCRNILHHTFTCVCVFAAVLLHSSTSRTSFPLPLPPHSVIPISTTPPSITFTFPSFCISLPSTHYDFHPPPPTFTHSFVWGMG